MIRKIAESVVARFGADHRKQADRSRVGLVREILLRLLGGGERFAVAFDVVGGPDMCDDKAEAFRRRVLALLRERFPHARVVVNVEPSYFRPGPDG